MDLNIWLILAQIINFWILFFIFKKFLWDKLVTLIKERKETLSKLWNVDGDVKIKMDEAYEKSTAMIEDARQKASGLEKDAESLIKQSKEKILSDAKSEAENILTSARNDIEKDRLWMIDSMKEKILDLSLKINSTVFDKKDSNKEFITKEVNSIKI